MSNSLTSMTPKRSAKTAGGMAIAGLALVAAGALGLWSASAVSAADTKKADAGGGWFSKSKDETAAKPATTGAATPAAAASGTPQAEIQTMDQLSKADVKNCLQIAKAVGQATMFGTEYAAAST